VGLLANLSALAVDRVMLPPPGSAASPDMVSDMVSCTVNAKDLCHILTSRICTMFLVKIFQILTASVWALLVVCEIMKYDSRLPPQLGSPMLVRSLRPAEKSLDMLFPMSKNRMIVGARVG
jgi:hypothetical protein